MRLLILLSLVLMGNRAAAEEYLYEVIVTPDDGQFRLTGAQGCRADGRPMLWVETRDRDHREMFCHELKDGQVILYRLRGGEYRRFPANKIRHQWLDEPCVDCDRTAPPKAS